MEQYSEVAESKHHEASHRKERSIAWPLLCVALATTAFGFGLSIKSANSQEETRSVYGVLPEYVHNSGYHDVNRFYADIEARNPRYCTGEYSYEDHNLRIIPGSIHCALMAGDDSESPRTADA